MGIISNGDLDHQALKLEKMGIREYFEAIITAGDAGVAKPDIRIFEIACEKAGVLPEECFYIRDDYKTDIHPCREAGIRGIWLNRNDEQTDNKSVNMIKSLNELKYIIKG